jgi:hypothetical protein
MFSLKITVILIYFILLFVGCSGKNSNDKIIARVDNNAITAREFQVSFHLYPKYRQNTTLRQACLQQINYMIDRIYLNMAAKKDGIEMLPEIIEKIEYIKRKEQLKRLYEKNVLDKIEISEQEAWEEYKRYNLQIRMRHLFATTKKQAQEYYFQLQNGASFSNIAKFSFKDSVLANNGGDLGFVTITDLDPFLVDSVYSLRIGEISKPIRSSFGYHIILVEDLKQSAFLSQEYFKQNRNQYEKSIQKRRAAKKSSEYVSKILSGKSVDINPPIFHQLVSISKNNITNRKEEFPFTVPAVTKGELQNISLGMESIKDSILVRYTGGEWTVTEFIEKLKRMPPLDRPVINREQEFIQNIVNLVRDELLLEEAENENIAEDEIFQKNFNQWKDALLAEEYFKRVYWSEYKEQDEIKWHHRKEMLSNIRTQYPAKIDTTNLYREFSPTQLDKKLSLINVTLREPYVW